MALHLRVLLPPGSRVHYDLADTLLRSAAALANVMNIYTPYCFANGGGDACILDNFIGHYWSLSLEEQFYLVFPLLFFSMGRRVLVAVLIIAIIVWLAAYDEGVFCLGRRYGELMLYLGSRSYSLYLCHLVVYLSLRDLVGYYIGPGGHAIPLIVTAVGITLACSELTYRYIETVFRARGRKLAERVARGGEQSQPPNTL